MAPLDAIGARGEAGYNSPPTSPISEDRVCMQIPTAPRELVHKRIRARALSSFGYFFDLAPLLLLPPTLYLPFQQARVHVGGGGGGGGEALRYSWLYRWRLYVFLPFPSVLFCPFVRSSVSSPALDRTRFSRPAVVGSRVFKSSQKARLAIKLPANARSRRIKANAARDGEKERKRGRANQPVRRRESG